MLPRNVRRPCDTFEQCLLQLTKLLTRVKQRLERSMAGADEGEDDDEDDDTEVRAARAL